MRAVGFSAGGVLLALALTLAAPEAGQAADGTWYRVPEGAPGVYSRPQTGLAVATDARRARALVFGGQIPGRYYGPGAYGYATAVNDVQAMDPTHGIALIPVAGSRPTPVGNAAAAYDSLGDRMWVFGGDSIVAGSYGSYTIVPTAGVWSLDLSQSPAVWTRVFPAGMAPAARGSHTMVFDPVGRRLVVFGGRGAGGVLFADTWSLSVDGTPTWTPLAAGSSAPAARYQHGAAYDPLRHRMLVAGGLRAATDTSSPAFLWALSLAGSPGWDTVATSGPAPTGLVRGLGFDRARNRLVVVPTPQTPASLDLAVDPPAWTPLAFAADPSAAAYQAYSTAFDDRLDVLYLPGATPHYEGPYGGLWVPDHFLVAFDRAPHATANPHLTDVAWASGKASQTWGMNREGEWWSQPHLERSAAGGPTVDAGQAKSRDDAAGTMVFEDSGFAAGADLAYRVRWRDYAGTYVAGDTVVHAPDAPASMPSTVDSAYVFTGFAHLQWTLANDSLSRVEAPRVWRRTDASGWVVLGTAWPDEQLRVRWVDTTLAGGAANDFELRWTQLGQVRSTGAVTLVGSATVRLEESVRDFREVRAAWRVAGADTFSAVLWRRFDDGPWTTVDVLAADAAHVLRMSEHGLPLGVHAEYRVGWSDEGRARYSPTAAFDVPAFTAQVDSFSIGSDRVRMVWAVSPLDTATRVRIERIDADMIEFWSVVRAALRDSAASVAFEDSSVERAHTYYWRLVANDGAQEHFVGMIGAGTYPGCVFLDSEVGAGYVFIRWRFTPNALAHRLWRRVNSGPFELRPGPSTGGELVYVRDVGVPAADSLVYRLEWLEWDGRWHAAAPVAVEPFTADGSGAAFVSAAAGPDWILTRWSLTAAAGGTDFQLVRATAESAEWDTVATLEANPSGERLYDDRAVIPATEYRYRVRWLNAQGEIGQTPEVRVATLAGSEAAALTFMSPARGAAAIAYTIPGAGPATLELFDVRGRLRASRVEQGPARLAWTIPAGTVEPGLYFLRLRSNAAVLTRRLVLLP